MTIDIIGAGIGGLTTAIALEQKGFKVRVFEQAKNIKPVGAGIILANNAMQVYEKLGLKEEIEAKGNAISTIKLTNANLKPLSTVNLSYFENMFKVKNIAIHRGELQKLLLGKLSSNALILDHKLKKVSKTANTYSLEFQNEKTFESTILLGADGINSKVRDNIFQKNNIRDANQTCWRGITDYKLPERYINELNEAWGQDDRFGFVQIAPTKVYWYALKSSNKLGETDLPFLFKNYHLDIKNIINSTKKENINKATISDLLPMSTWYHENVCLLGDAAHATTPNMGQGACQAIEDAYVLSECLNKHKPKEAFKLFQKLRLAKAHHVVKSSWFIGKMAHLKNPILRRIRNKIMSLMPVSLNRKQTKQLFTLAFIQ